MTLVRSGKAVETPDPGLQAERTALAWTRTAFAVLANALIALRSGYVSGSVPVLTLAVTLLLSAACTFVFATFRRHVLLREAATPVAGAVVAAMAATVLGACLTGVIAVIVASSP